jgi:hypothetical protein
MNVQDILKGQNEQYKTPIVTFHRGGIECEGLYNFIPYASMTRINVNKIPTRDPIKTLIGVAIAILGGLLLTQSGWMWTLLGIIAICTGIYMAYKSFYLLYGLNITMASSATYSFIADERHIKEAYEFLLIFINGFAEKDKVLIFNTGNGTVNYKSTVETYRSNGGPIATHGGSINQP